MRPRTLVAAALAVLILCAMGIAQKAPAKPAAAPLLPSEDLVNKYMHRMFGYDPQITWKILNISESPVPGMALVTVRVGEGEGRLTQLYVANDMKHAIAGEALPFGADPFQEPREELARSAKGPSLGPADAPVTLVEFSDLQCPHCKKAQPIIDQLVAEIPNSRLVFQHFPLEQIHKWAFTAATYAQCVAEKKPRSFWSYIRSIYDNQLEISEQNADAKLKELVSATGLRPEEVGTCASSAGAKAQVYASFELGRKVGVDATPTLFVNGRKLPNPGGIPYETLKKLVLFEAQEASKNSPSKKPGE